MRVVVLHPLLLAEVFGVFSVPDVVLQSGLQRHQIVVVVLLHMLMVDGVVRVRFLVVIGVVCCVLSVSCPASSFCFCQL